MMKKPKTFNKIFVFFSKSKRNWSSCGNIPKKKPIFTNAYYIPS